MGTSEEQLQHAERAFKQWYNQHIIDGDIVVLLDLGKADAKYEYNPPSLRPCYGSGYMIY